MHLSKQQDCLWLSSPELEKAYTHSGTPQDCPSRGLLQTVRNCMIRFSPSFRVHLLVLSGTVLLVFGRPVSVLHAQSASGTNASGPEATSTDIDAPTPQIVPAVAPQTPAAPMATTSLHAAVPADYGAPAAPQDHRRQGRQTTGNGQQHPVQDYGGVHFSLWDRTPFDAYLPGGSARSGQGAIAMTPEAKISDPMGNRGRGLMGQPGQFNQPNFGQFVRAAAGMNLRSSFGSFRMSFGDGLNAHASGPGGVGKGSAQAALNSSTFRGAYNFSTAAPMGSSGMHGAFSSGAFGLNGFSNRGSIGGAPMGAGSQKRPAPSLMMRMTF